MMSRGNARVVVPYSKKGKSNAPHAGKVFWMRTNHFKLGVNRMKMFYNGDDDDEDESSDMDDE